MNNYRLGTCWIFVSDDPTNPFDQWTNVGYTQDTITATVESGKTIFNRVDQIGNLPLSEAVWRFPESLELSFTLTNSQIDNLLSVFPWSVELTGASTQAFSINENKPLTGKAFCLVPVDEYNDKPWWDANNAIWMYNGIANVGDIATFKLAEEDDLQGYDVTVSHITSTYGRGGIGCMWRFGTDVVGFDDPTSLSYAVTNADTEAALNTAGYTTVRDLVSITGTLNISANTPLLTDLAGVEYAFNAAGLNVSSNNVSTESMSAFIHELWLQRDILGGNSCVIDISGNNGVNTQTEINDLVSAGCTVTQ